MVLGTTSHGTVAVGEVGSDGKLALLANLHAEETLIPALDDLALSAGEVQWLSTIQRRVELLAVCESSGVVNVDAITYRGEKQLVYGSFPFSMWTNAVAF